MNKILILGLSKDEPARSRPSSFDKLGMRGLG
jgi:hypothetical protein